MELEDFFGTVTEKEMPQEDPAKAVIDKFNAELAGVTAGVAVTVNYCPSRLYRAGQIWGDYVVLHSYSTKRGNDHLLVAKITTNHTYMVSEKDMPFVIGKGGENIKKASDYLSFQLGRKVNVKITNV
jgi:hypothetical protein